MKDLRSLIKEFEACSLQLYKEHNNPRYDFMLLMFSPDDYHKYVAFNRSALYENGPNKITVSTGNFYVNTLRKELFIDDPADTFDTSETQYRQIFKDYNKLKQFQISYLSDIVIISNYVDENSSLNLGSVTDY